MNTNYQFNFQRLENMFANMIAAQAKHAEEFAQYKKEQEEGLISYRKEQEEKIAKHKQEQEEKIAKHKQEQEEKLSESSAKWAKELKEYREETDRRSKEADKRAKDLDYRIGRLTNRIGHLVESIVGAHIHKKFNEKFGFNFTAANPQYMIEDNELEIYAEIDFYLQNQDSEMLIEVKTNFTQKDVEEHIKRIEKVKRYNLAHNNYRKIYAAIAGGIMSKEVKNHAHKHGFYTLQINGDNIDLEKPNQDKFW